MGANPVSCLMHRLVSLNKQSDDKRINFNCDIRVLDPWICNHLLGLEIGHPSF